MSEDAFYEPDSLDITPQLVLVNALQAINSNAIVTDEGAPAGPPTKALIILLWDEDQAYGRRFYNAGMRISECIALLEVQKAEFIDIIRGK